MSLELFYMEQPIRKYTFEMPKAKLWVEDVVEGKTLNLFAGKTKLNCDEIRNDIDPDVNPDYNMDAFEFVNYALKEGLRFNTVILDPPYCLRKSMEKYNGRIVSNFRKIKDILSDIICDNGIVITFGYHSTCMGKSRGFSKEKLLIIGHGGSYHDTIAVVERKILCLI